MKKPGAGMGPPRSAVMAAPAPARRTPGIAGPARAAAAASETASDVSGGRVESSGPEVLVFKCTGKGCHHTWLSGRGATSLEQICKTCGASVVGVLSQGAVTCETGKVARDKNREVLRIQFDRPMGHGLPAAELEDRLRNFVSAELSFFGKFFKNEGVEDYIAYRRGLGGRETEQRNGREDVKMLDRYSQVVQALCKAEFDGTLRGGEADAKLQGLLDGFVDLRFVSAPERIVGGGSAMTLSVGLSSALDIEDRVADKVDERHHRLMKVMRELDKALLAKLSEPPPSKTHPNALLARVVSGLDWQRGLNSIRGREGHDRLRCMTCRFIGDDCSVDVSRSQDVRRGLKSCPGFVYSARVVLGRSDKGGKPWQERVSDLLGGIAETKGGECFVLARTDDKDNLEVLLYSQPEWLGCAVDRLCTYAHGGNAAPFLSGLVGLGRAAKGLHVVEPAVGKPPTYEMVQDVVAFLDLFAARVGSGCPGGDADFAAAAAAKVRWIGSRPKSSLVAPKDLERTRALFRITVQEEK
eukprot:TRINITY_DN29840_c0_g2_i1.p1 TRINITY_DN29840_c0_g2~~TRINITY_DN29840_c0_g2_i1.p1  ORF type:complete len:526 (+),score=125.54 TRINITY_DN29840_c0_g2_i1:2-1579(+)